MAHDPPADQRRPTLILFCGLPGSGKTTLATELAGQGHGIRICTDDWQGELAGFDDPDLHERLQGLLRRHALDLLRHGVDVILEDGLWTHAERAAIVADARAAGARIEWHLLTVPAEELWRRLAARNAAAARGAHPVSRADLERARAVFDEPSPAEKSAVDLVVEHHWVA